MRWAAALVFVAGVVASACRPQAAGAQVVGPRLFPPGFVQRTVAVTVVDDQAEGEPSSIEAECSSAPGVVAWEPCPLESEPFIQGYCRAIVLDQSFLGGWVRARSVWPSGSTSTWSEAQWVPEAGFGSGTAALALLLAALARRRSNSR